MSYSDFENRYKLFSGTQKVAINVDDCTFEDLDLIVAHPAIHLDVRRYAELNKLARQNRLDGNVEIASKLEKKADMLYSTLPKHLRW